MKLKTIYLGQPSSLLRVRFLYVQIVCIVGVLAACVPASEEPATAAPVAQVTFSRPSPSATVVPATETPQPTPTPFPVPSRTPSATAVQPTETPQPTSTPLPIPTMAPSATHTVTPTESEAVPPTIESKPTTEFLATSVSQSPDGQWIAEGSLAYVIEGDSVQGYDTSLKVSRVDGSAEWMLVDYLQGEGLGYAIPEIHRWSADGLHAYFTNRSVPDGCALFVNGSDLHRADLTTGEVTELMPSLARALSLSPDETTVAYFPWGPSPDLVLRDLATGTERNLAWEIPFNNPGNIVWSADGSALALTLSADTCFPTWNHTIVKVDITTLETTVLVENDDRQLTIVSWPEPDELLLQDKDEGSWSLNTVTGELIETD